MRFVSPSVSVSLDLSALSCQGDDIYDDGSSAVTKERRVKEILGADKAHYMPLIDQLIFMEETHNG
jgi:hypothetical protein